MKVCNTKTQNQYNELMQIMEDLGWVWRRGEKLTEGNYWDDEKSKTCVALENKVWYEEISYFTYHKVLTLKQAKKYLATFKEKSFIPVNLAVDDDVTPPERIPTWDSLSVGDILFTKIGEEQKILGVCGLAYFLSNRNDFEKATGLVWTIQELKKDYTIKTPEKERTVEDVLGDLSTEDKALVKKAIKK